MIWAYRYTEKVIFLARWLTAPFFLALVAGILLLICKSFIEFYEVLIHLRTATGKEVIVGILNLVDFALMANLILIVIYSGYQNFIRRIDLQEHPDWPQDISESDFGGLKLKLLGSIVAIAAVETLEWLEYREAFRLVEIRLGDRFSAHLCGLSALTCGRRPPRGSEEEDLKRETPTWVRNSLLWRDVIGANGLRASAVNVGVEIGRIGSGSRWAKSAARGRSRDHATDRFEFLLAHPRR